MAQSAFDEMSGDGSDCRPAYRLIKSWLEQTAPETLKRRQQEAEFLFRRIGITFAVYGDQEADERHHPLRHRPARADRPANGRCSREA